MPTFHVPLSAELHAALKAEAQSSKRPATELVREALSTWLEERRRQRIADEILAYAQAEAEGPQGHDYEIEDAGIEHLLAADAP